MKRMLRLLVAFLPTSCLFAQTHVSGTIDGETWTQESSPYIVDDDLLVASLNIMPGVTVMADGDYEIEVAGLITAIGAVQDSIVFTTTDSVESWQGILFNITTFDSELQYFTIERAANSALRIINSTPSFGNCTLADNTGPEGGAIYFFNDTEVGSEFTVSNCTFLNNSSAGNGGALSVSLEGGNLILDRSRFENNTANPAYATGNFVGGAIYLSNGDAVIRSSSFIGNKSNSRCTSSFGCGVVAQGGALYLDSSGFVSITNSIFRENEVDARNNGDCFFGGSSGSFGAAIHVHTGSVALGNDIFAYNRASFTNCGPSTGGVGVNVDGGTATMTNSTVAYNMGGTGAFGGLDGTLDVTNSIIYFNNSGGEQIDGSGATVNYSAVQDGYEGEGNISSNPVFSDTSGFTLTSISPAIDVGNPDGDFDDVCFPPSRGGPRNDMGAYGGPGACGWGDTEMIALSVVPRTLTFPMVPVGGAATVDLTVSHNSSETVNVTSVAITGLESGHFNVDTTPFSLGVGEEKTLQVGFTPLEDGSFSALLVLTSDLGIVNVGLSGSTPSGVATEIDDIPTAFELDGAYPNPFNPATKIRFDLPEAAEVILQVFDSMGREVKRVQSRLLAPGRHHEIRLVANDLASGVYVYRLSMRASAVTEARMGSFVLMK